MYALLESSGTPNRLSSSCLMPFFVTVMRSAVRRISRISASSASSLGMLPPPKFVSTPPVYTSPQVMPQGGYNPAAPGAEQPEGDSAQSSHDPNPLR